MVGGSRWPKCRGATCRPGGDPQLAPTKAASCARGFGCSQRALRQVAQGAAPPAFPIRMWACKPEGRTPAPWRGAGRQPHPSWSPSSPGSSHTAATAGWPSICAIAVGPRQDIQRPPANANSRRGSEEAAADCWQPGNKANCQPTCTCAARPCAWPSRREALETQGAAIKAKPQWSTGQGQGERQGARTWTEP